MGKKDKGKRKKVNEVQNHLFYQLFKHSSQCKYQGMFTKNMIKNITQQESSKIYFLSIMLLKIRSRYVPSYEFKLTSI